MQYMAYRVLAVKGSFVKDVMMNLASDTGFMNSLLLMLLTSALYRLIDETIIVGISVLGSILDHTLTKHRLFLLISNIVDTTLF